MAQRGDLERMAVADRGDGAVIDAGRNGLDPGLLEPTNDLVGHDPGGEVDVVDGEAEQVVAHRAADIAGQALRRRRARRAAAACRAACATWRRRASAPLQPPRQVDDHRRGRSPDPPTLPVDLVIVALAALQQRAPRDAGWRDRAEMRAEPRTSRRLRAHAGASGRSGGMTPTTGVITKAGDRAVAFDRARSHRRPGDRARAPPGLRARRRRPGPRRDRAGRRGRRSARRACASRSRRTVRITPGSGRSVMAISTAAGVASVAAIRGRSPSSGGSAAAGTSAARRRSASAHFGVVQREEGAVAPDAGRVVAVGERQLGKLVIDRPRELGLEPVADEDAGGRAMPSSTNLSGWSGPRITGSPLSRREGDARARAFAFALHLDCAKGGRFDLDVELLDRRDQHVPPSGSRLRTVENSRTMAGRRIGAPS